MTMEGHLDARDDRAVRNQLQATRDADARLWMDQAIAPEKRLPAFDRWLRYELRQRLDWGWAGDLQEKRLEQCRIQIDTMILGLWRRGWMLDSRRLADRVTAMLDAVGKAQRAGGVKDFWAYFKATVDRYVGLNAEEIQAEAMSAGAAVGAVFQQLLKKTPPSASIPELVAQRTQETLREKIAKENRRSAQKKADAAQLPLI